MVYYRKSDNGVRWHTNTSGANGAFLAMQADGNAVVYFDPPCPKPPKGQVQYCKPDQNRMAVWYSSTSGSPGAYVAAQNDGNLVVYAAGGQPIWNIGADPVKLLTDPTQAGDLVGRDMESNLPYAYLGHIGFYDGANVYEVLNDGQPNAAAYNPLSAFKARGPGAKYWGTAAANIPLYFVRGCYSDYCSDALSAWAMLDVRMSMAYRAFQIKVLGADYTYLTQYTRASPRSPGKSSVTRGLYRCDTFVLDLLSDHGNIVNTAGYPINTVAPAESPLGRWLTFKRDVIWGVTTPLTIFNKMKSFAG